MTVVMTEAQPSKQASAPTVDATVEVLPGLSVRDTDTGRFWQIFVALCIVIALMFGALVAGGVYLWRLTGKGRQRALAVSSAPAVEPS